MAKRLSPETWEKIRIAYEADTHSNLKLADLYKTKESTIRLRAKKEGWIKNPSRVKRDLVKSELAKPANDSATRTLATDELIQAEASQDVIDMNNGLSVARTAQRRLLQMLEIDMDLGDEDAKPLKPAEIKTILESNKIAVETIRKIRGLDEDNASAYEEELEALLAEAGIK